MTVPLTQEECEVLESILTEYLADIRDEIYRTERFEYKELLKVRRAAVERIIEKLRAEDSVRAFQP